MASKLREWASCLFVIGLTVFIITGMVAGSGCTHTRRGYIVRIKDRDYDTCILDIVSGPSNTSSTITTRCSGSTSPIISVCYNRFFFSSTLYRSRDKSHNNAVVVIVFLVIAAVCIFASIIMMWIPFFRKTSVISRGLPDYERQPSQTTAPTVISLADLGPERPVTNSAR